MRPRRKVQLIESDSDEDFQQKCTASSTDNAANNEKLRDEGSAYEIKGIFLLYNMNFETPTYSHDSRAGSWPSLDLLLKEDVP